MKKSLLWFLWVVCIFDLSAQIKINELVASNKSSLLVNQNQTYDWVELYNAGNQALNLNGYFFTDDPTDLRKYKVNHNGLIVPAKGFLILYAADNFSLGPQYLPFGLSSSGESFIITAPDAKTIIDRIDYPFLLTDVSIGRSPDGSNFIYYFKKTSANQSNNSHEKFLGICPSPKFSKNSGVYTAAFPLVLSHDDPGAKIYYTTDGSIPDKEKVNGFNFEFKNNYVGAPYDPNLLKEAELRTQVYSSQIPITELKDVPNNGSMFASSFDEQPLYLPTYKVPKANVIRARAYKAGYLPSEVVSETYFVNTKTQTNLDFALISINTDLDGLFDYKTGIYTAGKVYDDFRSSNPAIKTDICSPGNFNLKGEIAEKAASFLYSFKGQTIFNGPIDLKLHGACSRSVPQKSLRISAKNNFSSTAFFPEFPDLFHKNLILRNGGNDQYGTLLRDVVSHQLISGFKASYQKTQPSIVYLNGEYWGIHAVRERVDNNFINRIYGVPASQIDMVKNDWRGPLEYEYGDSLHFKSSIAFINNNPLSVPSNYEKAKTLFDTDNLIDYQIGQIFTGNIDWPQNNVKLWRHKTNVYSPESPYGHDGRWRYSFFDLEKNMGMYTNAQFDYLQRAIDSPENKVFHSFLQNEDFRRDFINAYADKLNTVFRATYADSTFMAKMRAYEPEIPEHIKRWKTHSNIQNWWNASAQVRDFLRERPKNARAELEQIFNVNALSSLKLVSDTKKGFIELNSILIKVGSPGLVWKNAETWEGLYYKEVPVKLVAHALPGYIFKHWLCGDKTIKESSIILDLNKANEAQAIFEKDPLEGHLDLDAHTAADCGFGLSEWASSMPKAIFPNNAAFVYMQSADPLKNTPISGKTAGIYNATSKSRVSGLDTLGIMFSNTSSSEPNFGYPNTKIGGMVLALNTQALSDLHLSWKVRTIDPGPRKYALRLAYRNGKIGDFIGIENTEVKGSDLKGDVKSVSCSLPKEALNQEYVQVFWQYFYTGEGSSGSRDELALDDIKMKVKRITPLNVDLLQKLALPKEDLNFIELSTGRPEAPLLVSDVAQICGFQKAAVFVKGCYASIIKWDTGENEMVRNLKEGLYKASCQSSCGNSELSKPLYIKRVEKAATPELSSLKTKISPSESIIIVAQKCGGKVSWSSGQTGEYIRVNPIKNTTYTANCYQDGCLSSDSKGIDITVGKPQEPLVNSSIKQLCENEPFFLYSQNCWNKTEWSDGSLGQTLKKVYPKAGEYTIKARCVENGVPSDWSIPFKLLVKPKPQPPLLTEKVLFPCTESHFDLKDVVLGNTKSENLLYQKYDNAQLLSIQQGLINQDGMYLIKEKNAEGCWSEPAKVYVKKETCSGSSKVQDPPYADISVEASLSQAEMQPGKVNELTIILHNQGVSKSNDLRVQLDLPQNLKINNQTRISTEPLIYFHKSLKVGQRDTLRWKLESHVPVSEILKITAFSENEMDFLPANNVAFVQLQTQANLTGLCLDLKTEAVPDPAYLKFKFHLAFNNHVNKAGYIPKVDFPLHMIFGPDEMKLLKNLKIEAPENLIIDPLFVRHGRLFGDSLNILGAKEFKPIHISFDFPKDKLPKNNLFFFAQATAKTYTEYSTSGTSTDPDKDFDPLNNSEYSVFSQNPAPVKSGVAIALAQVDKAPVDKYMTSFTFRVLMANTGQSELKNVKLDLGLSECFKDDNQYSFVGISASNKTGLNFDYDPKNAKSLFFSQKTLRAAQVDTLFFTIKVKNRGFGQFLLQAKVEAKNTLDSIFRDYSNDGLEIKPENAEPTLIKTENFELPQVNVAKGVSRNADGLNDKLNIEIPSGIEISRFEIIDHYGRIYKRFDAAELSKNKISWDTQDSKIKMVPGTYFYSYSLKNFKEAYSGFFVLLE
jgi:hypothetical protein